MIVGKLPMTSGNLQACMRIWSVRRILTALLLDIWCYEKGSVRDGRNVIEGPIRSDFQQRPS